MSSPPVAGAVVLLTGLSGSGKTTLAEALAEALEDGGVDVRLLDGDQVRLDLSADLGFGRADRETNARRVAQAASEHAERGGVALCALVAPHAAARETFRRTLAVDVRYLLVHVATPLAVCERRDPKGLYARARAGTLPGLTGVDDPYETPDDADVTVDTSRLGVAEACAAVLAALRLEGGRLEGGGVSRRT